MSLTEEYVEKSIRQDILIDQYKDTFYDDLRVYYNRLTKRVGRILLPYYGSRLTIKEKAEVKSEITDEINTYKSNLENYARKELFELADVVYEKEGKLVEEVNPDIELNQKPNLERGLLTKLHAIDRGSVVSVDAMFSTLIETYRDDIQGVVDRLGTIVEEQSVAKGYFTGATTQNQSHLNSVSLTSVALVASLVKRAFFNANKRSIPGYQWISVLDGKTTDYCQFRHMKVWYFDDPSRSTLPAEEYPPGHFRCRSGTAPIFRGEQPMEDPNFVEWFERQPASVQLEVLGARRFEMYKAGDLDISDVNNTRGQRRTLEELKNL
jgi:SPP1 gp7 family putative phage head morphogenesis protein